MNKSRAGILAFTLVTMYFLSPFGNQALCGMSFDVSSVDIPHEKFVLDNGLTLIVHEDHKAPIVAFNVWYHVGSKNEPAGRSGFAHLFEHLMFNGSENYDDDYFQPLERVGATDLNGTTNEDRTNYFENVPKNALDLVLFMESDRMGHLLGAITEDKLNEQRGVVQNEKRQGDDQPYSIAEELITKATWPAHHPYSHTVIGSMADLDAASLDDVKDWFKTYYGAANAVVVVAGDITPEVALEKVKHYFGDIPAGPPVARFNSWPSKLQERQRQTVHDRVPQARLIRVFNIPGWGEKDAIYMDLVSDVLGFGKTSRLYKRLVYDDQIATNVAVFVDEREIAGQFHIEATARPGDDLSKVEAAIDEELEKFLKTGPTEQELERVKTQYFARFTRGIERIGGFGGKSDILARGQIYGGTSEAYKRNLEVYSKATVADLHNAARTWMTGGQYDLEILPYPAYQASTEAADRSKLPDLETPPSPAFATMEKATLSNGLKVIVATRSSIPVINMNLIVDAGYASDKFGKPGTSSLAMNMLDEGTKSRTALQISEELANLGATLNAGSNLDTSNVGMSILKSNFDKSLDLFADILMNPSFPKADFERLQKQQIAGIKREKVNPIRMALRVFPKLLYGEDHAYSLPFTGSGTEASVAEMTTEDLEKFHQIWIRPDSSTLVIVGDTTLAEMKPKLEKSLKSWKPGEVPVKNITSVEIPSVNRVFLIDKPGASQSVILAGHLGPKRAVENDIALDMANNIFGGTFTARVNMNLREAKHWSYGASTFLINARGQRPFLCYAPVQTDKTKESMLEIQRELSEFVSSRPALADELSKVQANEVLGLAGRWETSGAVSGSISEIVGFGLTENYFDTYAQRVKDLTLDQVNIAAKELVHPEAVTWIVVGDLSVIKQGIEDLHFGEITLMDGDGNIVK